MPQDYKSQIRASIAAAEPEADAIIYMFYLPKKARIGKDAKERCVVRCDFNPGSKKHGPPLMIVHSSYYFEGDKIVPIYGLPSDITWMDGEPKKDPNEG